LAKACGLMKRIWLTVSPFCRGRNSRTTYAESLKANQQVTQKSAKSEIN
jgi:hypothetical protein